MPEVGGCSSLSQFCGGMDFVNRFRNPVRLLDCHSVCQAIFHSSIRRVVEEKLTPIRKSFRESAAKGLA